MSRRPVTNPSAGNESPTRAESPTTVVLLRAVNVGGHNPVHLADLAPRFAAAGLTGARSVLASGNFVGHFRGRSLATLESDLGRVCERVTGREVAVYARSADDWRGILTGNPLLQEARRDPARLHLACLHVAADPDACRALTRTARDGETVEPFGRHAFIYYPNGAGRSRLTPQRLEAALGGPSTSRNWNTVLRLARLLGLEA